MTVDEPGDPARPDGRWPDRECSCGGRICGPAADDALLDSIAAGIRAVEEPVVVDLDEDVERELAAVLIEWRRSVRRHPETWSVDVDRAAVLVSRGRVTSPRRRRLLPGTSAAAAVVAGLVVVILWGTPPPAPRAPDAVALATSVDLDRASAALERGDLSQARIALTHAERRLPAAPKDDAARRLRVRYRALQDEVAANTSHRRRAQGPRAGSAPRSETDGPSPRRSARAPWSGAASERVGADEPWIARSGSGRPRTDRPRAEGHRAEGHRSEGHQAEGHRAEGHRAEGPRPEHSWVERPRGERHEQAAPSPRTPTAPATGRDHPRPRRTTGQPTTDRDSTAPSEADDHDDTHDDTHDEEHDDEDQAHHHHDEDDEDEDDEDD
ncbi:hypothetical protein [Actinomycetospora sp. CA-053990]|uniref:hypothetical protein n=1 Tax=Actinomycetospora sp. CA-053990 TaxID=3239891 RepID=UPI003D8E954B